MLVMLTRLAMGNVMNDWSTAIGSAATAIERRRVANNDAEIMIAIRVWLQQEVLSPLYIYISSIHPHGKALWLCSRKVVGFRGLNICDGS